MATPFMNLSLPVPTVTIGPAWATQLNDALTAVDAHDHTANKGKKVPSAGLNINADLDLHSHKPFNALSLQFTDQTSVLNGATNASSVYSTNGDLYFTNSSGTAVQITSGSSIVAAPSSTAVFSPIKTSLNLTISASDTFVAILVDTSAARTITLPSAAGVSAGRIFIIKDQTGDSLTNPITIVGDGSDTIEGAASYVINSGRGSTMLIGDGISDWEIL